MTIKSILLEVDATERSALRLAVARDLAERHDATVRAIYAATPNAMHLADADLTGEGASLMYTLAREKDVEQRERARRLFEAAEAGPRVHWAELSAAAATTGFVREALTADLLVLGQYDHA